MQSFYARPISTARASLSKRARSFTTYRYILDPERVMYGDFRFAETYTPIFKAAYTNYLTQIQWYLEGDEGILQTPILTAFSVQYIEGGPNVPVQQQSGQYAVPKDAAGFMEIHTMCLPENNSHDFVTLHHVVEYNNYVTAKGTSTLHCYDMYNNIRIAIPSYVTSNIDNIYDELDDSFLGKFVDAEDST